MHHASELQDSLVRWSLASATSTCSAYSYLSLIHGAPAWHAQHERALVRCGCAGCDAEASVPAAVDALGGVLEVQLHALQGAPMMRTHYTNIK
jgi:hypothetical protein